MSSILDKIRQLGDLDLAILASLISNQHCLCSTAVKEIPYLRSDLLKSCTETFGLETVAFECSGKTTVDEFNEFVLIGSSNDPSLDPSHANHTNGYSKGKKIADVIIATGLDLAPLNVQVQSIELLRTRTLVTTTSSHVAPEEFLFIAVLSTPTARLNPHLNDLFAISYFHEAGDLGKATAIKFTPDEIDSLRDNVQEVRITAEVRQYLHNIAVFMRLSRYVKGGVTAASTNHLRSLASALAPLHGLDYISPSLVELAAKKVYPHRLILATVESERSMQWGSNPRAVRDLLDGIDVDDVIELVLESVEPPI
ncbi:hypothetical protein K470DRAFT_141657 [Piedraia hortae CBS 480.64]|uniref:magnesium chelatase n=1 Tax=Piedraia hortae CBS 480.64 TaxID=1314780 RepID=A0A6A7C6Q7_9PEZI|nr:hypothetical protein K470DRAFT_141657 [Piedraia hortae CBS 480.64]